MNVIKLQIFDWITINIKKCSFITGLAEVFCLSFGHYLFDISTERAEKSPKQVGAKNQTTRKRAYTPLSD
jgi:hypothetical protein